MEADRDLKLSTADGGGFVDVAALFCTNCGFVRLHTVDVVRNRLAGADDEIPPD